MTATRTFVATWSDSVTVHLRQPDGSFTLQSLATDTGVGTIQIGDVDGDGDPDIVTYKSGMVIIFHRDESGWSRTEHPIISGTSKGVGGVEIADVSGDGRPDVVATNNGNPPSALVNVFTQNSDGTLAAPVAYDGYNIPQDPAAGDIDGDGRQDIVIGSLASNVVMVLLQKADGTMARRGLYESPFGYSEVAVGDINSDGRTDLAYATAHNGLAVLRNTSHAPPAGTPSPMVRTVTPPDHALDVARTAIPSISFQSAVNPATVTAETVRLVNGRTGAAVATSRSYDAGTHTLTLTPTGQLYDHQPYHIVVDGVLDTGGNAQLAPFRTTFRTVNQAPGALTGFTKMSAPGAVTFSWETPPMGDLDQMIVRYAEGATPPASPTAGISGYAGTGTAATINGLTTSKTYSFSVWARDRGGALSPPQQATFTGLALAGSASATFIDVGATVTFNATLRRGDTTAFSGQPVRLYMRRWGTSTWVEATLQTTNASGEVTFIVKPIVNTYYQWRVGGASSDLMGAVTGPTLVTVWPKTPPQPGGR